MRFERTIIVGGSSGLGAELARQLCSEGTKVCAVGRNEAQLAELQSEIGDRLETRTHDVRNLDEIPDLFRSICASLGGLDLLIYAAGVMPEVGPEEFDTAKDKLMIETNLLGCVAWCNEAADRFGGVGAGTILGIGSVAGDRGRRGQPVYNATKAGMATYLEALRNRLDSRGVCVVTIKPGPVATPMTAHLDQSSMMEVKTAAKLILSKSKTPGEHYLKLAHRVIFAVIRNVPGAIFRRLKI